MHIAHEMGGNATRFVAESWRVCLYSLQLSSERYQTPLEEHRKRSMPGLDSRSVDFDGTSYVHLVPFASQQRQHSVTDSYSTPFLVFILSRNGNITLFFSIGLSVHSYHR